MSVFSLAVTSAPIAHIKALVQRSTGLQISKQRLMFAGKQLENSQTCESYGICERATFDVIERLLGD
jgi:hypothetical protein